MAEKGVVIELKENLAVVRLMRTEACAKCRACIAGMSKQEMRIEAENECDAKVNDWVELELRENGFGKAVLIMYGIPFVALMIGIGSGYFMLAPALHMETQRDIISFGFGLLLTFFAFLWIRSQENRWSQKKYRPIASRITEPDETAKVAFQEA